MVLLNVKEAVEHQRAKVKLSLLAYCYGFSRERTWKQMDGLAMLLGLLLLPFHIKQ